MLNVLEYLMDLPLLSGFPIRGFGKVSSTEQPIRQVEAVSAVFESARGLSAPFAGIYSVEFLDGSKREVFIWGDPTERDFESATFLKAGRKTDVFDEIRDLMTKEPVPRSVIEKLREYEVVRDSTPAALRLG